MFRPFVLANVFKSSAFATTSCDEHVHVGKDICLTFFDVCNGYSSTLVCWPTPLPAEAGVVNFKEPISSWINSKSSFCSGLLCCFKDDYMDNLLYAIRPHSFQILIKYRLHATRPSVINFRNLYIIQWRSPNPINAVLFGMVSYTACCWEEHVWYQNVPIIFLSEKIK